MTTPERVHYATSPPVDGKQTLTICGATSEVLRTIESADVNCKLCLRVLGAPQNETVKASAQVKPRLLDLFCGAGGAAMGYHKAGFEVWGADLEITQLRQYPFRWFHYDAMRALREWGQFAEWTGPFDAIHASPPCQGYTQFSNLNAERWGNRVEHPMLIEEIRELLRGIGLPYVIENVQGAPLEKAITLCGSMFGLDVRRHRIFESSQLIMGQPSCHHTQAEIAIYGKLDGRRVWTRVDGSEVRAARTIEQARSAMGIDWMDWDGIKEAVPPAYTEFIGSQLIQYVGKVAA